MSFANKLDELRLLHMRALVDHDELTGYHVEHERGVIRIKNEFGGGWNFFADERGDDVWYQTLEWIKMIEDDAKKGDWDTTNPDHLRIAVQAYKDAFRD